MMMMTVIVRWCPPLSVDPCIGRHTHHKTLSHKDDDDNDDGDDNYTLNRKQSHTKMTRMMSRMVTLMTQSL